MLQSLRLCFLRVVFFRPSLSPPSAHSGAFEDYAPAAATPADIVALASYNPSRSSSARFRAIRCSRCFSYSEITPCRSEEGDDEARSMSVARLCVITFPFDKGPRPMRTVGERILCLQQHYATFRALLPTNKKEPRASSPREEGATLARSWFSRARAGEFEWLDLRGGCDSVED